MAKNAYIGIGGVARKIKQPYIGIGGVARKVKNGYVGVGGVARQFYTGVDPTLDNNDWATISSVAASGTAANYWSVGDRKAVKVNGTVGTLTVNATYYVYIIGFAHNGASNTIDFGTFKTALSGGTDICLVDSRYDSTGSTDGTKYFNMNHSDNTNEGGWKSCDLRYDVLGSTNSDGADAGSTTATSPVSGTLMAALPSDLRAVMKPMTVYTDNVGGTASISSSRVTSSVDYLPLLAEFELYGTQSYANKYEQDQQAQYAYYSAGNSKLKYAHNATSTACRWWLRSPRRDVTSYSKIFCRAGTSTGEIGGANASYAQGVAPIFRV